MTVWFNLVAIIAITFWLRAITTESRLHYVSSGNATYWSKAEVLHEHCNICGTDYWCYVL